MLIASWKTLVVLRRYLGSNEEGQRQALAAAAVPCPAALSLIDDFAVLKNKLKERNHRAN